MEVKAKIGLRGIRARKQGDLPALRGPWPKVSAKLPPVIESVEKELRGDWVDVSDEFKKVKASALESLNIKLKVNGKNYNVDCSDPAIPLAYFLREYLDLTGTKIGCGEGGCGACTVMVRFLDEKQGKILNACLCPLASLNGAEVTTIEGLGNERTGLHPVQKALAEHNGSQCGYCSPGMAMAMYGMLKRTNGKPSEEETEDAFQGNICRCTGYRPILNAAKSFANQCHEEHKQQAEERKAKLCDNYEKTVAIRIPDVMEQEWYEPKDVKDASDKFFSEISKGRSVQLIAGNTGNGIMKYYQEKPEKADMLIHISRLPELMQITSDNDTYTFGSAVTLADLRNALIKTDTQRSRALANHIHKVANHQVRNVGTWAGNLVTVWKYPEFPSDIMLLLIAADAKLKYVSEDSKGKEVVLSVEDFLNKKSIKNVFIISVTFDLSEEAPSLFTYKVMPRHVNAHALLNAAFSYEFEKDNKNGDIVIKSVKMAVGRIAERPFMCPETTKILTNSTMSSTNLKTCLKTLEKEIASLENKKRCFRSVPPPPFAYLSMLTISLFYKSYLSAYEQEGGKLTKEVMSAAQEYQRPVSKGTETFTEKKGLAPVNRPVIKLSAKAQCCGEAKYTSDHPKNIKTLYAYPVLPTDCGKIKSISVANAMAIPGVVAVITANDIKKIGGSNNCGAFPGDEPIFAEEEIFSRGQFVALVVASNERAAEKGSELVEVSYSSTFKPITSIREAISKGSFYKPNKFQPQMFPTVERGDVSKAWAKCKHVFTGELESKGQSHFYMETQSARAVPLEQKRMFVEAGCQGTTEVRQHVCIALNKPAHMVDVVSRRVGGSFGGKHSRSMPLATAVAVAAEILGKPVKGQLDRKVDMRTCGGRHPILAKYKIGVDENAKIVAFEMDTFFDGGYTANDTFPILDEMQIMLDNAYYFPNYKSTAIGCKTNLATNTQMRAPGILQGIYCLESIMDRVATDLKIRPEDFRKKNFYTKDQLTPLGETLKHIELDTVWNDCLSKFEFSKRLAAAKVFNSSNRWRKRGVYITPCKYGLQQRFYKTSVLVNICLDDGTVTVAHSGIEMGQGINTKVAQSVAHELNVSLENISVLRTTSATAPNGSVTAGSGTSETTVNAAISACAILKKRLAPYMKMSGTWASKIQAAYTAGVNLSAMGYWGVMKNPEMPGVHDYFSYSACASEVELDVLTGEIQITRCDISYDCGQSMNQDIDMGQVEGAFIQTLGYFLTEGVDNNSNGRAITAGTWEYFPPTALDVPQDFNVNFVPTKNEAKLNTYGSKATGEPSVLLGASVFLAALEAVKAARSDAGLKGSLTLNTPALPVDLQQVCGVDTSQLEI